MNKLEWGIKYSIKLLWHHFFQRSTVRGKIKQMQLKIKLINSLVKWHLTHLSNWCGHFELCCSFVTSILQKYNFQIRCIVTNTFPFVFNQTLHWDFNIPRMKMLIHEITSKHNKRLEIYLKQLPQIVLHLMNNKVPRRYRVTNLISLYKTWSGCRWEFLLVTIKWTCEILFWLRMFE